MQQNSWRIRGSALALAVFAAIMLTAAAFPPDEGMWTFDNIPLKWLQERYGFTPTPEWLDHIRLSSVRFNDGGSGSFVSPSGLVLTNHHVARGQLQKMSSAEKDYVQDGFYAKAIAEEIKCPDLELNVLVEMENVTARVLGAVQANMSGKAALDARKAEIAKIEKESTDATGLRSDIVPLYQGGEYWLYRYKKYTDVRLVFAPEQQIAFFGGDPDNFTFPRHDLDMTLMRVYENDKPLATKDYLKWNANGAAQDELVFVSGHPGSTNRLNTQAQIEFQRDHVYPYRLALFKRRLDVLRRYSALGPEQARQAQGQIFGIENSQKASLGEYHGLLDAKVMAKKQQEESDFRAKVAANAEWKKMYATAWDEIANAQKQQAPMLKPARFRALRGSRFATMASTLVMYATETKKPDAERLDGFHEAQLASLRFRLFSSAPVYPQLEEMMLADGLQESLEQLGANDPFIKLVLNGRPAAEVAKELINNTKLGDPAVRKSLAEGGDAAIAASNDPLILIARKLDPMARELNKWFETNVQSVEVAASEKLGKARFAVYGKTLNPDATFTLRLSYGTVASYPMNGTKAQPMTTIYGLYDRAFGFGLKAPFNLPQRFIERKDKLTMSTPANFVTTNDIIGGNSGSPVINKNGEIVGLIFDGNIESLVGRYVYNIESNRAVAVHTGFMIEALRKLYDAAVLADELEGKPAL